EVKMALMTQIRRKTQRAAPVPRELRAKVESLLLENYAFMDSPVFRHKNIERELFDMTREPELPRVAWYQPTRDDALSPNVTGAPQLMKGGEERLMFLRFNFAKKQLGKIVKTIQKDGLTKELGEKFLEWHRRFEHFREYLVRTNLALVLAM